MVPHEWLSLEDYAEGDPPPGENPNSGAPRPLIHPTLHRILEAVATPRGTEFAPHQVQTHQAETQPPHPADIAALHDWRTEYGIDPGHHPLSGLGHRTNPLDTHGAMNDPVKGWDVWASAHEGLDDELAQILKHNYGHHLVGNNMGDIEDPASMDAQDWVRWWKSHRNQSGDVYPFELWNYPADGRLASHLHRHGIPAFRLDPDPSHYPYADPTPGQKMDEDDYTGLEVDTLGRRRMYVQGNPVPNPYSPARRQPPAASPVYRRWFR
jgi:hypothetical protein